MVHENNEKEITEAISNIAHYFQKSRMNNWVNTLGRQHAKVENRCLKV